MSTKKSAPKRLKGSRRAEPVRRYLLRVPVDLADWIDDTAASLDMSRDAFMRVQMKAIREGFKLAEVEGTEEATLFRKLQSRVVESTERAVREAVDGVMRATSTGRITSQVVKRPK